MTDDEIRDWAEETLPRNPSAYIWIVAPPTMRLGRLKRLLPLPSSRVGVMRAGSRDIVKRLVHISGRRIFWMPDPTVLMVKQQRADLHRRERDRRRPLPPSEQKLRAWRRRQELVRRRSHHAE